MYVRGMKSLFYITGILLGLVSCFHEKEHTQHNYQKVVVLGNSITRHPPLAAIGWNHNWGMAASAPEKDYLHILTRRFQQENPSIEIKSQNIAEWENTYWRYDLHRLDTIRASNPDLVLIRLGENVKGDSLVQHGFARQFVEMLRHVATDSTRIIVAASWWPGNPATTELERICKERGIEFVAMNQLFVPANTAIGQYQNSGVASHPNDAGMQAIADLIWQKL